MAGAQRGRAGQDAPWQPFSTEVATKDVNKIKTKTQNWVWVTLATQTNKKLRVKHDYTL